MKGSATSSNSLIILTTFLVLSCSSGSKKYDNLDADPGGARDWEKISESVPATEVKAYRNIQSAFSRRHFKTTISRSKKFISTYQNSALLHRVENLFGLSLLAQDKNLQAVHRFRKAIQLSSDEDFKHFARYNLASAQYEAKQVTDADETLALIDSSRLDLSTRLKYHYLRALVYARRGAQEDSAEEILASSYLLQNAAGHLKAWERTRQSFEKQLQTSIRKTKSNESLETLLKQYGDSPLADGLLFELAKRAKKLGKVGLSESYLRELLNRFPNTPHYVTAVNFLRQMQESTVVDQRAVGVLLPLTGKFSKFGRQSLQGVELAFRVFNQKEPDSQVTLYIGDSGESVEESIKALDRLYYENHVSAVIGPLLSKGVEAVTQRAEDLGVPMISLAQKQGTPGNHIFYSAVTLEDQAREIAQFAIQRGMRKFAILYPQDKFGDLYANRFWDAVESLGGEIVDIENYAPKETDFRIPIDRITGTYYPESRKRELEALQLLREQDGITRRNRRTEQYYKLPPIVEFDAVFIPDEATTVSQILPTFAYRDVEDVQYLGVATWNSTQLLKRAQKYAEGAFFTDTFFPASPSPVNQDFVRRYQDTFGSMPTAIEALSYDAALLLERALITLGENATRSDVRELLTQTKDFPGVTGMISYQDGQLRRNLKMLTISRGKIIEASKALPNG